MTGNGGADLFITGGNKEAIITDFNPNEDTIKGALKHIYDPNEKINKQITVENLNSILLKGKE